MDSHRRTLVPSLIASAPVVVAPAVLGALAYVESGPHLLSFLALGAGVVIVARRRGIEAGCYTGLLSSAALFAILAHDTAPTAHPAGWELIVAMAAFLAAAVVAGGAGRAPVVRDAPVPSWPQFPTLPADGTPLGDQPMVMAESGSPSR